MLSQLHTDDTPARLNDSLDNILLVGRSGGDATDFHGLLFLMTSGGLMFLPPTADRRPLIVQLPNCSTVQLISLAFLPKTSYFYPTHFILNDLHNDVR
jgi:hypothetical protein